MAITPSGSNTWDNSGVKYPKLHQRIMEIPFDAWDMRQLLMNVNVNTDRYVIPKEVGSSTATVDRVAEGAETPLQYNDIESQEIETYKIGRGFEMTWEMVNQEQIPIMDQRLKALKLQLYNTVNYDIIMGIIDGVPGANIVAASGTSLGRDMSEVTIAGTPGEYDITEAIRIVKENYKKPNLLICNPLGAQWIERLPHYSHADIYGEAVNQNGLGGRLYGMQVVVSNQVPSGTMLIMSTEIESVYSKQYTPLGFFVLERDIDIRVRERNDRDAREIYAYMRYGIGVTRGENIAKITYTSSS